jgi:hypothetical protein
MPTQSAAKGQPHESSAPRLPHLHRYINKKGCADSTPFEQAAAVPRARKTQSEVKKRATRLSLPALSLFYFPIWSDHIFIYVCWCVGRQVVILIIPLCASGPDGCMLCYVQSECLPYSMLSLGRGLSFSHVTIYIWAK